MESYGGSEHIHGFQLIPRYVVGKTTSGTAVVQSGPRSRSSGLDRAPLLRVPWDHPAPRNLVYFDISKGKVSVKGDGATLAWVERINDNYLIFENGRNRCFAMVSLLEDFRSLPQPLLHAAPLARSSPVAPVYYTSLVQSSLDQDVRVVGPP